MYSYGRLSRDAGGSNRSSDLSTRSDDEDEASVPGDEVPPPPIIKFIFPLYKIALKKCTFISPQAEVDGFIGYRNCTWKLVAYWVGVVLTGGALGLFTLWWPGMWPALTKKRASMADATSFLVQVRPPRIAIHIRAWAHLRACAIVCAVCRTCVSCVCGRVCACVAV